MIGRFLVGFGVGVASMIVPLYISEIAPVHIRGFLVSINNFMITFGQVIASCLAFACGSNWRLMLGIAAVPSVIQFIFIFFMPESPRWLGKTG